MNRVRPVAAALFAIAGLALAACGRNPYADQVVIQPAAQGQQQPANTATGAAAQVKLVASTVDGLGTVLTDQDGRTLYRFAKDKASPSQATCANTCAQTWPPLLSDTPALVAGVDENLVSLVTRPDGRKQVTVAGWPVYRYAKDTGPGVAIGQNASTDWSAITPTGGKAGSAAAGSQDQAQNAGQGTTVGTTDIGGLGTVLTDQNGKTLYLFTKDSRKPSKSTCDGACATTWPPLLVTGQVTVTGVDQSLIGQVMRSDGAMQVTIGGWPVYTYSKDNAPGQANGHGVGNTWYAVEPNGCRVDPNKKPTGGAEQAVATTSATDGGY